MPPRGPLAHTSTRWRHEGQRQHITRWYGLGGEESSSTAIIQALSPDGETVPSRRHNQTDSESGKEATRLTPKRCWSRLLFFRFGGWWGASVLILLTDALTHEVVEVACFPQRDTPIRIWRFLRATAGRLTSSTRWSVPALSRAACR